MQIGPFKFNKNELAGSLGDLGTLIPLLVGLVTICGVNPGSALFVVGLLYVASGLYYRVPMPVQPLKAMAAIAIAMKIDPEVLAAGAMVMGIILLFLSLTNLIGTISKVFSRPVVRGIQLGLGLILMRRALIFIFASQHTLNGTRLLLDIGNTQIPLGIIIGIVGLTLLFVFRPDRRFPGSILIVLFGIIMAVVFNPEPIKELSISFGLPGIQIPDVKNFKYAFLLLVIPQLPLTIGNAVVATEDTARKYFGNNARRVSIRTLPITMGAANILASLFGGLPVCHGSGGLTAHYKWGARTGGSNIIIGSLCIFSAIFLGEAVVTIFSIFPNAILGVLLLYVGVHHSLLIRDLQNTYDFFIAFLIAAVAVITTNLAIGFMSGLIIKKIIDLQPYFHRPHVPSMKKLAHNISIAKKSIKQPSSQEAQRRN